VKVLIATSEAIPFAKTGGLADVTGSLAMELRSLNVDARLIMPMHRGIKGRFEPEYTGTDISVPLGSHEYTARIFSHEGSTLFIECDEFFDRKELYGTSQGDYDDNAFRFVFFSRAVLEACAALGLKPDVIHCNDWQTGLVPLYMRTVYRKSFRGCVSLFTIHNIGYQGMFPASAMTLTGLDPSLFNQEVLEHYGQVNLLKAGITSADAISTVSENYASEILSEEYGYGIEGILRKRAAELIGIINGISYDRWNPVRDGAIPHTFSSGDMSGKKKCRNHLIRECNFGNRKLPLASIVGRLSSQKGIDVFLQAADGIMSTGVNMVILGRGEERLQKGLRQLAKKYADNIFLNIGFDEDLSHVIYAGSDMLLVPSRYEPCGLTQMIAMRYGTVPVARATGGLKDTIEDFNAITGKGTGFLFSDLGASALEECFKRAVCVFSDEEKWGKLARKCMKQDFSWDSSARKYASFYRKLAGKGLK
jgi:starch synthase